MSKTVDVNVNLETLRIISKKELLRLVPYCGQHIARLERQGKFPMRIDLGANRVGWYISEIEDWIRSRPRRRYHLPGEEQASPN